MPCCPKTVSIRTDPHHEPPAEAGARFQRIASAAIGCSRSWTIPAFIHTAEDKESASTDPAGNIKPLPPGTVNRGRDDREHIANPFAQIAMADIRRAYESLADKYPPVLSLKQAAEISGVATSTLKRHVSEGKYKDCVSRGKPLRFWRDKFVQQVMKDK